MKCKDCMYSTKCVNGKIKCLLKRCIFKIKYKWIEKIQNE